MQRDSSGNADTALRVVALVSGSGSNLRAIIKSAAPNIDLVGVVADRACKAIEWCEGQCATKVVDRESMKRREWHRSLRASVAAFEPDLVVLAGFMRIVDTEFVRAFEVINIHPSLLPAFPGLDAPQQAIDAGVKFSGCTVHRVDEGIDTGTILAQAIVPVMSGDSPELLHKRIQVQEHLMLPAVINNWREQSFPQHGGIHLDSLT